MLPTPPRGEEANVVDVYKLIGYGKKKKWPSNSEFFLCIRFTHLMVVDLFDLWAGTGGRGLSE